MAEKNYKISELAPTPETEEAKLEIEGHDEDRLSKQARTEMGAKVLENTLGLIKDLLGEKTSPRRAKELAANLRSDEARLAAIKAELLENINLHQGDDKRDKIAERIANELITQSPA